MKRMKINIIFVLHFFGKVYPIQMQINTLYGQLEFNDPLIIELIESTPFQRLKQINQYGIVPLIFPSEKFTRFEHSLGVYLILQKAQASKEELIAGLLHDVSHTVFSHVGDYVYQNPSPGNSYQDDIHIWYLKESGLEKILDKYGMSAEQISHKQPSFLALDQPLPHLCADRIDYNLQGGLLRGLLTQSDFQEILGNLHYIDGKWVLKEVEPALKLARCSLTMTETLWGAPWEALLYRYTADALQRAFEINLVSFHEFHFSTDALVWQKLSQSQDEIIVRLVKKMHDVHSCFELSTLGNEDLVLKVKFRGLDPLVQTNQGTQKLTSLHQDYSLEFKNVATKMVNGWPIQLL